MALSRGSGAVCCVVGTGLKQRIGSLQKLCQGSDFFSSGTNLATACLGFCLSSHLGVNVYLALSSNFFNILPSIKPQ